MSDIFPVGSIWARPGSGRAYIVRDDGRWLDYPSMQLLRMEPSKDGLHRMTVSLLPGTD